MMSTALSAITLLLFVPAVESAAPPPRCVVEVVVDGVVQGATASLIARGRRQTARDRCEALLITLNTPGGRLDATRDIVRGLLDAKLPVVVFVSPAGARAASAGALITMAAHVAAMAPGTHLKAGRPVSLAGGPNAALRGMAVDDTAAFAHAAAERRGRNTTWMADALAHSATATATADGALARGVVDLVALDVDALLEAIDGTVIDLGGAPRAILTAGAERRRVAPTVRERAQGLLGHPAIAYALLMLAIVGIVLELAKPGLAIPGALGAGLLLLAGVGLNLLPVRLGALALLAASVALVFAEVRLASFGLLAVGGITCLVAGSALFIDHADAAYWVEQHFRVPWAVIAPVAVIMITTAVALSVASARHRYLRLIGGNEAMLGQHGRALTDISAAGGTVRLRGESWRAVSIVPVHAGELVQVIGVRHLTLHIAPRVPRDREHAAGTA